MAGTMNACSQGIIITRWLRNDRVVANPTHKNVMTLTGLP